MPDIVRINNTIYSWESVEFTIDGNPWTGLVAVDTEQKRERKKVYAARKSGRPLGRTRGKYSVPTFTMKILVDSFDALTDYLCQQSGSQSYGDSEFDFTIGIAEPGPGLRPITIIGTDVAIVGEKDGYEEGVDELLTEVELDAMSLTKNGKNLWSEDT